MAAETTVLLLHGEEQFLVSQESAGVLRQWREPLVSDFGLDVLDAGRITASQLRDAVLQLPFLDPYRVVVAKGVAAQRSEQLAAALESVPETTRVLLTVQGKLAAGNRLVKAVSSLPGGKVREFGALKGRRLSEWAAQRAAELKLPANVPAAVVRSSPPHLGVIDSELQKLAAYRATGHQLDAAALGQLLAGGREDEFFQLTDRILPRVTADAWRVLENLLDNGANPTTLGYRLARHLSLVLEVRVRQERGDDLPHVQAEMREHPFVVQKAFETARSTTPERLQEGLEKLLKYEWEVKSGQIDAGYGLEGILATL